ncbi:MAG: hypothetical protein EZS28_005619 [Streblomastix strix]|uniref:Uncharacterized protein n=1 Tax=Streblomastix strix TaxID=222440 RepID=A0A5J4WV50_9EUKA|nr:MAG: hypothetical protein EZS28_005619 [Streblomastix strix]
MHNLSLSHVAQGYDEPNSHIHSIINSTIDLQQEGQTSPALGSPFIRHGQSALDCYDRLKIHILSFIHYDDEYDDKLVSHTQSGVKDPFTQYAGQTIPALGSPVVRQLHFYQGIPFNSDEFVGHLQPEGQFDGVHAHESVGTVQSEQTVQFFSDQHVEGGYFAFGLESQTQFEFGMSFVTQQAGHQPLPALGSPVLKHGQLAAHCSTEQSLTFVSQTQLYVTSPLLQQVGQIIPARGSFVGKHGQSQVV